MTIFVFTGPTLAPEDGLRELDATYLPPVEHGDVYRLARLRPLAIGIIDGYFERVPAVWHKEILWAMHEGIHVFGSASMGALRAAELAPFGMQGVGSIYEAFLSGSLEDDDEVAIAHGPAESGYVNLSEAMVNIRSTLASAMSVGVIRPETEATLVAITKQLFYPDRSYARLLRLGAEAGLPAAEVEGLRHWLPKGRIDQKRTDALAMLRAMRAHLAADSRPKRTRFTFEHTIWWDQVVRRAGDVSVQAGGAPETLFADAVLDELRLSDAVYERLHEQASVRQLALAEAERRRFTTTPEAVRQTAETFRLRFGLAEQARLNDWLGENRLSPAEFERLMREEALIASVRNVVQLDVIRRIPDQARISGQYGELAERARRKREALAQRGLHNPSLQDAGISREQLIAWHCARQGREVPANIAWYAGALAFPDEEAFILAQLREYLFEHPPAAPHRTNAPSDSDAPMPVADLTVY